MASGFTYNSFYSALSAQERRYAPQEIFWQGDMGLLEKGLRIAVVGSRKMSARGQQDAECIARTLVDHRAIVVSGLAEGIDTMAHTTAIAAGGKTIAVLGTPLDVYFPAANRQLQDQIMRDHLAISQFAPGSPVGRQNFPIRNRTMALITEATIIVEASENSGTRHQGWEALRLGRLVFIMEHVLADPTLTWPKKMQEYGAQALTCQQLPDILPSISHARHQIQLF